MATDTLAQIDPDDFEISVDLEPEDSQSVLGRYDRDQRNADVDLTIGDLALGKATIRGAFSRPLKYGECNGRPACFIHLAITISSASRFRLSEVDVECYFSSPDADRLGDATGEFLRPRILRREPHRLIDRNPTFVDLSQGWNFTQSVDGPSGSANLRQWDGQRRYKKVEGCDISSSIRSRKNGTNRDDMVCWNFLGGSKKKEGLSQDLELFILVEYQEEQPFYGEFDIYGKLFFKEIRNLKNANLWFGHNRASCRRNFAPERRNTAAEIGLIGSGESVA
ncbi:MAG: hypothetical protein M1813_006500 [Trichoglossum hirsutum]|nr:MAG: hypothetical protein M1813_006500 [Trichoglossum hirsutum]